MALERAVHVHRRTWILTSGRIHGGRLARLGDFCYNGRNEWEERNMVRFFVLPEEMGENFLVLTGENAAHAKVLRLKVGDPVTVCRRGREGSAAAPSAM